MAFNQHTTPTALDQLIHRAKNEYSVHTFSRSFDTNPTKVTTVTKLFRSTKHPSAIRNSLVTQFLFVLAGKIFPLTRPCITSDDGNAMYIGSMSDELGECITISVPAEGFTRWFTSIVPAKDANDFGLPSYLEPPDTMEGKPSAPGASDGEAGSLDWLNLGPDAAALDLRILALLMVLPVPWGVPLPTDTWEVGVPNPEMTAIFPFVEVWRKAQHYIIDNNDGWLVTVDGPLFDQSKLEHGQTLSVGVQPRGGFDASDAAPHVLALHARQSCHQRSHHRRVHSQRTYDGGAVAGADHGLHWIERIANHPVWHGGNFRRQFRALRQRDGKHHALA
jgi:hypothetical protein